MRHPLANLLRRCTVRLRTASSRTGTGFFVAPSLVLTCAHVVGEKQLDGQAIKVTWSGREYEGEVEVLLPAPLPSDNIFFPDLALLRVDVSDHPCVLLHEDFALEEHLFGYGYPIDRPFGSSVTIECEGPAQYGDILLDQQLIQLKAGQILPGMSGAPLLNLRTGGVCGVVKRTRDEMQALGGDGDSDLYHACAF